jgi:hypothetical protein
VFLTIWHVFTKQVSLLRAHEMSSLSGHWLIDTVCKPTRAGVAKLADGNKRGLALSSACLLALVPWMQISRAVSSHVKVTFAELAAVVAAGVVVHLAYLAFNSVAVHVLRIGGPSAEEGDALPTQSPFFVPCIVHVILKHALLHYSLCPDKVASDASKRLPTCPETRAGYACSRSVDGRYAQRWESGGR